MKFLCITAILAILCIGKIESQQCHLRELDLCAATLLVFTNNPSETTGTDEEIERQCGFIREAEECHKNFTSKCATESQKELVEFLGTGGKKVADEFCTAGTKLREDYKKHAKCMSESRKDSKKCTKDLKAALEIISDTQWDKRISTSCCAFNRFDDCLTSNLRTKCGDEAVEISRKLVRLAASRLPEIVCQSYKGDKCTGLLPPSGTAPTGTKSNSLLSRVFSTYVGNQD
ncbi:uncharacterized protein LOC107362631 [Tetranychus urticae]|uniref:DUF19 domain-containing protein n=1 Tax=Tetranychus urticae TaxID=32264 RepID=T1KCD5_TETUR|nr:uncharacterized protein LOC107362631 [Tetranychus urticae]